MTDVAVPGRRRTRVGAPRPPQVGSQLGVELDGTTVSWATADGGTISRVERVVGTSPGAAVGEALRRARPSGRIVVAWSARSGVLSERAFPLVGVESRRSALDALVAGAGSACARLGARTPGRNDVPAVVGTADPDEVAGAWHHLDADGVEMILAPMVLSGDGVWMGVGRVGVSLTLVTDGAPRLSRRIATGGLDALAVALGPYGDDGWQHLDRVLNGRLDVGTEALHVIDEHVSALSTAVKDTIASWRRAQRFDASTVYVFGPGSALPTIEARLAAVGIDGLAPPPLQQAPSVDAQQRADGWLAIQAALVDPTTLVGFANQPAAARRAAIARVATRTRRLVVAGLAAGTAAAGLVVPVAHGRVVRHLAHARLAAADREIRRLAADEATYLYVDAGTKQWTTVAATEPDWARTVDAILKSAPAAVAILGVDVDDTADPGFVSVTVHADAGPTTFADLESWAATLTANRAVSKIFAPSAQSDAQPGRSATKTTFELQFEIAVTAVNGHRPFPGGAG